MLVYALRLLVEVELGIPKGRYEQSSQAGCVDWHVVQVAWDVDAVVQVQVRDILEIGRPGAAGRR